MRKFASLTALVVLLAPLSTARAATHAACTAGTKAIGRGHNPVPRWRPSRVDQGVDGTLSGSGYRAVFDMRIVIAKTHAPGWANGGYIAGKIRAGDLAGEYIFVAEGVRPRVRVGQVVKGGARIADRVASPYNGILGNIETGFADPGYPGRPLAQSLRGYSGDQSTAGITAGCAMNRLIGDLAGSRGYLAAALRPDWSRLPHKIRRAVGLG